MATVSPSQSMLKTGNLLIHVGVFLTILQWILVVYILLNGSVGENEIRGALESRAVSLSLPSMGSVGLSTMYPGLILAALGTVLHVTGYLGARPWKRPPDAEPADR